MDMNGEYRIAAPRQTVWQALNDPDVLRQCIPGCEELEKLSDTEFTAKAKVKVGPVSARFTGRVTLSEVDPPNGYRIAGEGQGGAAGFGKGGATVSLVEDGPEATLLSYTADAQVGGKLAQIGSRLVQGTARKMADDFFAKFSEVVAGSAPTPEEEADEVATELLVEAAEEAEARPEVPSSGMPHFASVPLAARPDSLTGADSGPGMAHLAEPHHRLEEEEPAAASTTETPEEKGGLRPAVWIPILVLALLALIVLLR